MEIKKVVDVHGNTVSVDMDSKKLYEYSNKDGRAIYNVNLVENGEATAFYTDISIDCKINDIEEKLKVWNNSVLLAYARYVDFNASDNDPHRLIWEDFVRATMDTQDILFDEYGDWKKDALINVEDIQRFADIFES